MRIPKAGAIKDIWEKWGRHIFEQTFTFPDGREADFFVFDNVGTSKPVIVFPLTKNREVIAVKQFRYGANAVVLEPPGGSTEPGQTTEETLQAELVEETGYRPGTIVSFNRELWFEPASTRVTYVPFLALDCVFEKEPTPDQNEVIEVVTIPYDDWIELIYSGGIKDDKTIAVTFLVELYFRNLSR